ncbi:hypothetical protein MFLO_04220 [Listeria floridensis FSL S10-1187]|uniref:Uncharacterized protein n=1 Tax=Listeria floridensis FSL S10-1187 TaxID=1265817 RepID=A0ABN0RGY3_9LIST|nr:hypothetical protein [Listeria floridensis]EUJ33117.1 hypothetical protein MFLO_04220 [Listeria floridensis FSL S10-1187]
MMTEKQEQFIDSLMKKKEYEPNDTLIQAHRSGMDLSKSDASRLIDYLLACDDVKKDERPLGTLIDMTKSALYRTIKKQKSLRRMRSYWQKSKNK